MKKLKLNLDEIKVESFKINSTQKNNGTVQGYNAIPYSDPASPCPTWGYSNCETLLYCGASCMGTCCLNGSC